jgi:hypothetical protein
MPAATISTPLLNDNHKVFDAVIAVTVLLHEAGILPM